MQYNNSSWKDWTMASNINNMNRNQIHVNHTVLETMDNVSRFAVSSVTANGKRTPSSSSIEDHLFMSWWMQLGWMLVFSVMILIAIGGNCIVMWIVIAHRRMRTVTNYFLVNLSTADLLLSTLNCSFNFNYMLQGNWQFGSIYCTINNFMAYLTVAASVFTLTGITCDRYLAIVHPLQPRMSRTTSLMAITLIWGAGALCAAPCLLYSKTIPYKVRGKERIACIMVWPDGNQTVSQMDFAYQVLFLILTYAIPIALMIACYTGMGRVLWGSRTIGEMTQRQEDAIRSKRKVVKMFIFIVSVFAFCWLPYHIYFIYTHYDREILYSKYVQHVYLGFYWFAMSNAMVNPLIYYWMNARFRSYFRTAICGWQRICCVNANDDETERLPTIVYSYSKSGLSESTRIHVVGEKDGMKTAQALDQQKSIPHHRHHLQQLQNPKEANYLQLSHLQRKFLNQAQKMLSYPSRRSPSLPSSSADRRTSSTSIQMTSFSPLIPLEAAELERALAMSSKEIWKKKGALETMSVTSSRSLPSMPLQRVTTEV